MQQQSDIYQFAISHNNDGIRYMKMKEYDEANRCFRIAIRYVRSFVEAYCDRGSLRLNDGSMKAIRSSRICGTNDLSQYADVFSYDAMIITADESPHANNFDLDIDNNDFRPILIESSTIDTDYLPLGCNGDNAMERARILSIILYNMGICYIRSLRVRCCIDETKNNSELLPFKALQALLLSHQLTQTMILKFHNINAITVQTWYGIHQIEFRILSVLIFLYHNNNEKLVAIRIEERIRHIQQVLHAHEDMVHFLRRLSSTTNAPCA